MYDVRARLKMSNGRTYSWRDAIAHHGGTSLTISLKPSHGGEQRRLMNEQTGPVPATLVNDMPLGSVAIRSPGGRDILAIPRERRFPEQVEAGLLILAPSKKGTGGGGNKRG